MLSMSLSNPNRNLLYFSEFLCALWAADPPLLSRIWNDNSTFLESHFIHQRSHQVNPTTMTESGISGVVGSAFFLTSNPRFSSFTAIQTFIQSTAVTNIDLFSRILMISVDDRVGEGFP